MDKVGVSKVSCLQVAVHKMKGGNMVKDLRVHYDGKVDAKLDKAIMDALVPFGLHRWASGYDAAKDIRDLAFDDKESDSKK